MRIAFRLLFFFVLTSATLHATEQTPVAFNRDVRPILSQHCFRCHGPDVGSRKASLRLDRKEDAFAVLKSGAHAIVAGDIEASELVQRIDSNDPAERMPPVESGKPLSISQRETLRQWIAQGARWEEHWSLIPPRRPPVPNVKNEAWLSNEVDLFVLARLEANGIGPSPEAEKTVLIRRLAFDLTGLPPTDDEVEKFLCDDQPNAFSRLVDRLLASPHYGERLASWWLDLVRYADTVGYHSDVERSVSLYRDYVINSLNANLPFDQFTIEQLAGDLLPKPTAWQRVASAYNMLGMTTEEGGAQAKEYLAKYSADRVRNLGSVWMGATLGCAECHDHKYDPYGTRDFYAFAAFFADLRQSGVGTPKPTLTMPTEKQAAERNALQEEITRLKMRGASASSEKKKLAELQSKIAPLDRAIRATIVSISGPPATIRILNRGDWMDDSGPVVTPAVPPALTSLTHPNNQRPTRLDLARWLVASEHPQTARVVVNRLWKLVFGSGLVDTLDDLGSQGEWPTHPALLDWLAVDFREHGWDIKRMLRMLVNSSTYKQASHPRDDLTKIDPMNRLYARQTSFRHDAESIRDNALAVSGLLVREIGGESVRPYQPEGYWRFLNFPTREYISSKGPSQYRRALYTHWQRTLPHPSLVAFDAPSRETCTAKRPISNTPQAALVLLNDPSHVEAARALAEQALKRFGEDSNRISWIWKHALSRPPKSSELKILQAMLEKHASEFKTDLHAAQTLIAVGQKPADPSSDPASLAALTSVARAILNLDETITRD